MNPDLSLEAGRTYRIGWTEGDGTVHNIEILDDDENVVDGLETELTTDPNDGAFLTFEATEETAAYACEPHRNTMRGEIGIEGATPE